jgi:hypothetical protein
MPYTRLEIAKYAQVIGRSSRTLRRWVALGCVLENPVSVRTFQVEMERKKSNAQRVRERRGTGRQPAGDKHWVPAQTPLESPGNGELTPRGERGAGAALRRLEEQEERAHARLQLALEGGDPFAIDAAQSYWLRVAETLRRLDAGLELGRRSLEEQVPKKLACDVALAIADWLRIAFAQFLSSEVRMLMGFKDVGEFKAYAFSRFVSILHLTVRNSLQTNSPIPDWAAEKVKESWNVQ